MESYHATDQATVSFDANWKVYTDNFVEGYHIPGTHPSFFAAIDFEAFQNTSHDGFVRMTAPPKDGRSTGASGFGCGRTGRSRCLMAA